MKFDSRRGLVAGCIALGLIVTVIAALTWLPRRQSTASKTERIKLNYQPRQFVDISANGYMQKNIPQWGPDATLEEISAIWDGAAEQGIKRIDVRRARSIDDEAIMSMLFLKSKLWNFVGNPEQAYQTLTEVRSITEKSNSMAEESLYSVIFAQGVTALRIGENDNCILCRGESSCILPISRAALHTNAKGSRLAIKHFTEYLDQFPEDLGVQWLLNLAHMTLGEHPDGVDSSYLVTLERFNTSEFEIGRFRDIGHITGLNRFNQAGGAIMDDFDNDGRLDIVTTTYDPSGSMSFRRNRGDGTFDDCTLPAGLTGQLGGLNCVQTDYNNDGFTDIYVIRGAWGSHPVRPSLLRNNQDGTFSDVTAESGLLDPVNSISAAWADYDNDGCLDLFVCCEQQPCRLFRNLGNGQFEQVAEKAGLLSRNAHCKGATWIDYDNDSFPDLFVNYLTGKEGAQMFHNNRDGTFTDVTRPLNIDGPVMGFSCWSWDYDNDGWSDLFATCYDKELKDFVRSVRGEAHEAQSNRLYRNLEGKGFQDVTHEAGLDQVFVTMGSNFGDFDNDGYLDMYLGTGEPDLATLVPNRMFRNVSGQRFADITASSGTGNLQKGHGVACGDWDRDGDSDIFIEMGGAVNGDRYHNILFQNPGQANHFLTVKLTGRETNRQGVGARIKVVVDGETTQTIYRNVTSGSSFGANPFEQTLGLGRANRITILEVYWPSSNTVQTFRDLAVDQVIAISESDPDFKKLNYSPIEINFTSQP